MEPKSLEAARRSPLIHVSGDVSGDAPGKGRDSAGCDTLEQFRRRLEASLNELGTRADALHAADNPLAKARPDVAPNTAARHLPH